VLLVFRRIILRRKSFLFCFRKTKNIDILFRSNLVYYPLAQQSALQQPVYLTPTTAAAAGTTWPTNLFSQFNLPTASNTNVSTAGTSSPQTIYELPPALFESSSSSSTTAGQQLYWPSYN
jgi:hypothetical protein